MSNNITIAADLVEDTLELKNIYLDPNNPRIIDVGFDEVPYKRIKEDTVQNAALTNISNKVGIKDIYEKVKRHGFLKIDRVVVKPYDDEKYVVIEGNRRIAALKVIHREYEAGKIDLTDEIADTCDNIDVLVYRGEDDEVVWLIQGMRHIKGVKDWGPFQQGKFLQEMQERRGSKPTDLAEMTGLGRKTVANLIRSTYAWEQASKDDDYGDKVTADTFALFNEGVFKKPSLRDWLGWDDDENEFENEANLTKLLGWYLGDEDVEDGESRLDRVNPDVRDYLSRLLLEENRAVFEEFDNGNITIEKAIAKIEEDKIQTGKVDLAASLTMLEKTLNALNRLPVAKIISSGEDTGGFIELLEEIENTARIQKVIIKPKEENAS